MTGIPLFLLGAVGFLAYTNGANDNFKGVATLFGSRTTDYRRALSWGTIMTFLGSLAAIWISKGLVKAFSGRGFVPDTVTTEPAFLLAVGLGAALTVLLATLGGWPISTTHALTGALVGAGWMAVGPQIHLSVLTQVFFLPLAASPFLSLGITVILYPLFRTIRVRLGITKRLCLCVGPAREPVVLQPNGTVILQSSGAVLKIGELSACVEEYQGVLFGVNGQRVLDALHHLSAGLVSFARGLNDAPKIVALLVTAQALPFDTRTGLALVATAMALGGIFSARKVAHTMSQRITPMNHGQGFTANLVTSALVVLASRVGVPVSTTHVSCGALFGIGLVTGQGRMSVIRNISVSWLVTLPVAACLAAAIYRLV